MKYFTIHELTKSTTAKKLEINNTPSEEELHNIRTLIEVVLDPLRQAWGRPILVNSGYRCEALNKAVGGAKTSHHLKGMAADITTGTRYGNKQLFELAIQLGLPFTQLIDEKNYQWVHISYNEADIRKEVKHL